MKSDLKLNFGILEDVIEEINKYKTAIENINFSVIKVNDVIEENSGEAIDALKEQYDGLIKDIEECYNQLDDLYSIFSGYIRDMNSIIKPKNVEQMIRVDRNDIWWNLDSIVGSCEYIPKIPYSVTQWGQQSTPNPTEIQKRNEESNYRKIEAIKKIITGSSNNFNSLSEQMKTLFNTKVVPYEEMDDYYGYRASDLKDKYTDFLDSVGDLVEGTFDFVVDVVKRIFDSFVGLVVGLVSLAEIISFYNDPFLQAGYVYKKITGDTPDFLKDRIEKRESFENGLVEIIQSILGTKLAGIGKVDDLIKIGVKSVDELIELGIKSVDDLAKLGVKSADDLAKLGIKNMDDLSKLGIKNADDLSKLGFSADDIKAFNGVSNPKTDVITGTSPIELTYAIKIPKGTTIYEGPVGYQGSSYLGGESCNQIFVSEPWKLTELEVLKEFKIQ